MNGPDRSLTVPRRLRDRLPEPLERPLAQRDEPRARRAGRSRPDVTLLTSRPDHEPFADMSRGLVFLCGNRERVTLLFEDLRLSP